MKPWILQAILSAVFAGVTAVLAKVGLSKVPADTGLAVRTLMVSGIVWINALALHGTKPFSALDRRSLFFLLASGVTTAASWIYYHRAVKDGEVSTVALIDKGSILITLVLAYALLGEAMTLRVLGGAALITGGLLLLAWK